MRFKQIYLSEKKYFGDMGTLRFTKRTFYHILTIVLQFGIFVGREIRIS